MFCSQAGQACSAGRSYTTPFAELQRPSIPPFSGQAKASTRAAWQCLDPPRPPRLVLLVPWRWGPAVALSSGLLVRGISFAGYPSPSALALKSTRPMMRRLTTHHHQSETCSFPTTRQVARRLSRSHTQIPAPPTPPPPLPPTTRGSGPPKSRPLR